MIMIRAGNDIRGRIKVGSMIKIWNIHSSVMWGLARGFWLQGRFLLINIADLSYSAYIGGFRRKIGMIDRYVLFIRGQM